MAKGVVPSVNVLNTTVSTPRYFGKPGICPPCDGGRNPCAARLVPTPPWACPRLLVLWSTLTRNSLAPVVPSVFAELTLRNCERPSDKALNPGTLAPPCCV